MSEDVECVDIKDMRHFMGDFKKDAKRSIKDDLGKSFSCLRWVDWWRLLLWRGNIGFWIVNLIFFYVGEET